MKAFFQEYATFIVAFFMSAILATIMITLVSDKDFRKNMEIKEPVGDTSQIENAVKQEEKTIASLNLKSLSLPAGVYSKDELKKHIFESAVDEKGKPVSLEKVNVSLKGVDTTKCGEYKMVFTIPYSGGTGVIRKNAVLKIVEKVSTDNGHFFLCGRVFDVKKNSMTWKEWAFTPLGEEFDFGLKENYVFSKTYSLWVFNTKSEQFLHSWDVIDVDGNYTLLPYEEQ